MSDLPIACTLTPDGMAVRLATLFIRSKLTPLFIVASIALGVVAVVERLSRLGAAAAGL